MSDFYLSIGGKRIEDDDDDCFEVQDYVNQNVVVKPMIPAEVHRSPEAAKRNREPADNERTYLIKTYVTREERSLIRKAAGHTAVSTWARRQLLRGTGSKYPIEIRTGDIEELLKLLSDYNLHANGLIAGLRFRRELYQIDIDHMVGLMDELNKEIKEAVRMIRNDRKYEKRKTEQEIERRLKRISELHQTQLEGKSMQYGNGRAGRRK